MVTNSGNRIEFVKRESRESLEARDLLRLRRLLAQHSGAPGEEDYEQRVHNNLFRSIAEKMENSTKYFRQLTGSKYLDFYGFENPFQQAAYRRSPDAFHTSPL